MRISSYIKTMYLQHKAWERMNNITPQKTNSTSSTKQKTSARVGSIQEKLRRGQKLTTDELAYLRENAPELYQKAVRIMQERKDLEEKLKSCKSKEDALAAKTNAVISVAHSARSSERNQTSEEAEVNIMRLAAIEDVYRSYVQSGDYQRLPNQTSSKEKSPLKAAPPLILYRKQNKRKKV